MNKSYNMNIDTGEKTWLTPPEIIRSLGPFDLDPCCPPMMPWRTATQMVHWPDDGLKVDWTGKRVWLNPPYGREAVPFLRKMAENKTGGGIAFLFGRTDTSAWHDFVFPNVNGVLFLRGRIRFHGQDGTKGDSSPAPSVLVAYSEQDFARLRESGLRGAFLRVS
jgi:hypothetical protein